MRCADVIEVLSTTTDSALAPAELAEHLAHCPRCAAWAQREARLTRLWEATRPDEPGPAIWSTVWAKVTQALETTPATLPTLAPSPFQLHSFLAVRSLRRRAWASFAIAQAAVVLLAAWFLSGPRTGPELAMNSVPRLDSKPKAVAVLEPTAAVAVAKIEIDAGEVSLLQSDGVGGVRVATRSDLTVEGSSAVDSAFAMLNAMEAMAE